MQQTELCRQPRNRTFNQSQESLVALPGFGPTHRRLALSPMNDRFTRSAQAERPIFSLANALGRGGLSSATNASNSSSRIRANGNPTERFSLTVVCPLQRRSIKRTGRTAEKVKDGIECTLQKSIHAQADRPNAPVRPPLVVRMLDEIRGESAGSHPRSGLYGSAFSCDLFCITAGMTASRKMVSHRSFIR